MRSPRRSPQRPDRTARSCRRRVAGAEAGWRLDAFLRDWLPGELGRPLSHATVRRLVLAGVVRVDGRPVRRPAQPVVAGASVEASVRLDLLGASRAEREGHLALADDCLLYLDEAVAALDKPAGLLMHAAADPGRPDFVTLATRLLSERLGRAVRLGIHQRLDRETSGVVLVTLDRSADAPLADAFARHAVAKTYEALCHAPRGGLPGESWRVAGELAPVGRGRRERMGLVHRGGQRSETLFRLVERLGPALLVEARPLTGRKHQVRAHLAASGSPLLGDALYGPGLRSPVAAPRVLLHARRLELAHPLTATPLRLESPRPADFSAALEALRRLRLGP